MRILYKGKVKQPFPRFHLIGKLIRGGVVQTFHSFSIYENNKLEEELANPSLGFPLWKI